MSRKLYEHNYESFEKFVIETINEEIPSAPAIAVVSAAHKIAERWRADIAAWEGEAQTKGYSDGYDSAQVYYTDGV